MFAERLRHWTHPGAWMNIVYIFPAMTVRISPTPPSSTSLVFSFPNWSPHSKPRDPVGAWPDGERLGAWTM